MSKAEERGGIDKYYFEVLAVDTSGKIIFSDEKSFCYNFLSNKKLLDTGEITGDGYINDKDKKLSIKIKKNNLDPQSDEVGINQSYTITISGPFNSVEPFRLSLLGYLKESGFDFVYVLEDGVSRSIATSLYPEIYKVESFLRKYVIKFFTLKIGPEWWKLTADSEMKRKTDQRKNNETDFSKYIDNEVYLVDFGELGKIIYSQSSGYLSKEDIVNKIIKLEHSIEALERFKEEIQTNYNKFFKQTFKENNFQLNWEELEKIRHKIAHNNLFTLKDQENATALVGGLIRTIKQANLEIDKISFSEIEKENIMSNFIQLNQIDEEEFIRELERSIEWCKSRADGFVGLQNFIVNILGSKGYDFEFTRNLIASLEKRNVIEIYTYINPAKNERGVAAIRFKNR